MELTNNLYDNESYYVRVGNSIDYDGPAEERLIYQIVNKHTEVVEREDYALPHAIENAKGLAKLLAEVQQQDAIIAH